MAKSKNKDTVYLISTESGHYYTTTKNKKTHQGEKIELKKYDPIVRKHVLYREGKLKSKK